MSRIRSRGNKDTELALATLLRAHRITGWRRNQPVFGKPDFVFAKLKLAIFVDGCFWHGCPDHGRREHRVNAWYWPEKIQRNVDRDADTTRRLMARGWTVIRIWEHEPAADAAARVSAAVRLGEKARIE